MPRSSGPSITAFKSRITSYGASGYPGTIVEEAFASAYAQGVLHIASAGNSGNCSGDGDSVGYPGAFASVVAVAAHE